MSKACRICGNIEGNIIFQTKEMMFGFRDPFNYVECKECGTVQIEEIPGNIEKYYPDNYYSYSTNDPSKLSPKKLDVGSGSGKLLLDMQKGGFTNLVGIDIFLPGDIQYECGVNIYKKD